MYYSHESGLFVIMCGVLTIIGTHVAFRTAKMMYVLYPMLLIAGGVI